MQSGPDASDERIAYALLRVVAGVNLLMHGVSRTLAGPANFAGKLVDQFAMTRLPPWSVWGFGLLLPSVEMLLGALLLPGVRTKPVLIGCGVLMVVLTIGSALVQDWSATGWQLVYGLVFSVLLFMRRYNGWSVDSWMGWD
jgi:thiosulfate dehydrogenase [quinone] large subunit